MKERSAYPKNIFRRLSQGSEARESRIEQAQVAALLAKEQIVVLDPSQPSFLGRVAQFFQEGFQLPRRLGKPVVLPVAAVLTALAISCSPIKGFLPEKSPPSSKTPAPPKVGEGIGETATPTPEVTPTQEATPTPEPNPWYEDLKVEKDFEAEYEGVKIRGIWGITEKVSKYHELRQQSFKEVIFNPDNPAAEENFAHGVLFAFYAAWKEDNLQREGVPFETWLRWFKEGKRDLTFYIGARTQPGAEGELHQPVDPRKAIDNLRFIFFIGGGMIGYGTAGFNLEILKKEDGEFQALQLGMNAPASVNRLPVSDEVANSYGASGLLEQVLLFLSLPEKTQLGKATTTAAFWNNFRTSPDAKKLIELLARGEEATLWEVVDGKKVFQWERLNPRLVLRVK